MLVGLSALFEELSHFEHEFELFADLVMQL